MHGSCPLCTAGTHSAKEGACVSDTAPATVVGNVYSETQHFALLESAVERETAKLSDEKEALETQVGTLTSEKASLADELAAAKSRIDVLEAEKASAEAKAETVTQEFANFKAELELQAQVAEKKSARIERIKAANTSLGEDFFTAERAQRWAEMTDETFESLVADITEAAAAVKPAQTPGDVPATELAKESAAFTGGQTATSTEGVSTLASFLGARRRGVA